MKIEIENYFKNPIIISALLCIIVASFIFYFTHFQVPDFYTNREIVVELIETLGQRQGEIEAAKYENPQYKHWNIIFQIFALNFAIFITLLCFRIKKFSSFKNLININNKKFIFLWINLSFFIYFYCWLNSYMNSLEMFVYNSANDSMGIPFFKTILYFFNYGLIFLPCANIIAYIVYKTKSKNWIYFLPILYPLYEAGKLFKDIWYLKFDVLNIFLFLYCIIWFALSISTIKFFIKKIKTV